MSVDDDIDDLYGATPERFTALRAERELTAAAAAHRDAEQTALAASDRAAAAKSALAEADSQSQRLDASTDSSS